MTKPVHTMLVIASMVVAGAGGAWAVANPCMVGKVGCVSRKVTCLLGVEAEARRSGTVPDARKLQRCRDRFDGGANPAKGCFAKVDGKLACPFNGDPPVHESAVDALVQDVVAALDPNPAADPNRCTAGKLKCVRDKIRCLLEARRRLYRRGSASPSWFQECRDRFDGGGNPARGCFARLERKGGCLTSGDAAALEARVDAFESSELCVFAVSTACPTPSPSSTIATPTPSPTPTPTPPVAPPCVACACPPPPTPATPIPTCTGFSCPIPTPSPPPCGTGFGPPACGINSCPYREVCTTAGADCGCAPCCSCS